MLKFSDAVKLPFVFYGRVKFTKLSGEIIFKKPPQRFMCGFGKNLEIIQLRDKSELRIEGTLVVKGNFDFGNDFIIHILKNAHLEIGANSYFGRKSLIICTNSISIGKSMRFGYESQIIDSNFHYTVNLQNGNTQRLSQSIILGNYTWIGNRTTIMSGTKTNDYLIVSSNSLLNKDYRQIIANHSLIGGIPAKLLREGIVRVFDSKMENIIGNHFKKLEDNNFSIYTTYNLTDRDLFS